MHSFAQEVKKENKAKIKMELVDEDGNKKVIDTTFTIEADQDFAEIIRQIKMDAGFSEEELVKMKSEMREHAKEMEVNVELLMEDFDRDKMHEHMIMVREEMQEGKEELQKALEELKVELNGMKMNEEAMKKLEKAMKELHEVEWTEHAKHLEVEMKNLHEHLGDDVDVFFMDGKHIKKNVWVDDDGEKHIVVNVSVDVDGDSLVELSETHNVMFMGDRDVDQNVWVEKDGDKIIIKKSKGGQNMVFFGDDADLETIHEIDGDHKVIVRKLKGEASKGDAIFISEDAHMIKEFKDEDGNVKVIRYKIKSGDGETEDIRVMRDPKLKPKKDFRRTYMMISELGEAEIAKATTKGIYDLKADVLELNDFTFNVDNDITTFGTTFEKKGKLTVTLFDSEMNQIWEQDAGKVKGEWSTELPSELMKDAGKYFLRFNQAKKSKLLLLGIK